LCNHKILINFEANIAFAKGFKCFLPQRLSLILCHPLHQKSVISTKIFPIPENKFFLQKSLSTLNNSVFFIFALKAGIHLTQ